MRMNAYPVDVQLGAELQLVRACLKTLLKGILRFDQGMKRVSGGRGGTGHEMCGSVRRVSDL